MSKVDIANMVQIANRFFETGKTKDVRFRVEQLNMIESSIKKNEDAIYSALKADLNKSKYEAFMTEIGLVYAELDMAKKKLKSWAKPKRKMPGFAQMPASVKVYSEPYGTVLIMSPWNYPFQLSLIPLIGAIAAGNCCILKPSAYSPNTSRVVDKILSICENGLVQVVQGGREQNKELLEQKFDYIFFTGSPAVGHLVMEKASKHLTPVTLELGGKSPCIVDNTADIKMSAKRILFGKLLNNGQTCVAPDYVLVHKDVKDKFIDCLKNSYHDMVSDEEYSKANIPCIINEKHYKRITNLMKDIEPSKIVFGGTWLLNNRDGKLLEDDVRVQSDSRLNSMENNIFDLSMDFTVVDEPSIQSSLMAEEIFAPILPILTWSNKNELYKFLRNRPKPLALYAFTSDNNFANEIIRDISFGGGCINDTMIHISSGKHPFGGVGNSGMGRYHGKYSFDTFSHKKTVVKKGWGFDVKMRYHPYTNSNKTLPKWLLK